MDVYFALMAITLILGIIIGMAITIFFIFRGDITIKTVKKCKNYTKKKDT